VWVLPQAERTASQREFSLFAWIALAIMLHTESENQINHTRPEPAQFRPDIRGALHLRFTRSEAHTVTRLRVEQQRPPLRVIRAFPLPEGGALVHLHNLSGGVLGGDQLELHATLEASTYAQLTSTSATRLYRSRPGDPPARQNTLLRVGEHALLEYLPDPLIPFASSRYQQVTRIELAQDAGLFYWEIVAPGRSEEHFAYQQLFLDLDIYTPERPIACERAHLEPALRPLTSSTRLGPYTHFCTFYICRVGLDASRWTQLERELAEMAQEISSQETLWGVSTLPAHGLVIRALSKQGRTLQQQLPNFWHKARTALYGRSATMPRKIY
jgi:urease accessory protein